MSEIKETTTWKETADAGPVLASDTPRRYYHRAYALRYRVTDVGERVLQQCVERGLSRDMVWQDVPEVCGAAAPE